MLRRLLNSCANVTRGLNTPIKLIIVENDSEQKVAEIVNDFRTELDIEHILEPKLGLVHARNRSVDSFLKSNAEWMVSIDDDCAFLPGWFEAMEKAIHDFPNTVVFTGPMQVIPPKYDSPWFSRSTPRNLPNGTVTVMASTSNAFIHRSVFAEDGLNLRFDPKFNLSGGEDSLLFGQILDKGKKVRWITDAQVQEVTADERGHFAYKFRKSINRSAALGRVTLTRFGKLKGALRILRFALAALIRTLIFTLAAVASFPFNRKKAQTHWADAMISLCTFLGKVKMLTHPLPKHYETVDGY